jgi:hypothetical protein
LYPCDTQALEHVPGGAAVTGGVLAGFDKALFRVAADRFTILDQREVVVLFRDGTEIIIDVVMK